MTKHTCYTLTNGWVLKTLADSGRICIALFAFVSGYGFFQKYTLSDYQIGNNVIRTLFKIVISYEITLGVIVIYSRVTGIHIDTITLLKNVCLIDFSILPLAWYVRFYCLTLLMMPILLRGICWLKTWRVSGVVCLIFISGICFGITRIIGYKVENIFLKILYEFFLYIPFVLAGSICNSCDWMNRIETIRKRHKHLFLIFSIAMQGIIIFGRTLVFHGNLRLDTYLAVLFSISLVCFKRSLQNNVTQKVIQSLGEYSLGIWLFHSLFFFPGTWPQNIVYFWKIAILQITWALLICYAYAVVLDKVVKLLV